MELFSVILLYPINDCIWVGWHSVPKESRISPLEEDPQVAPEVGDGLSLQLARVSGQALPSFFTSLSAVECHPPMDWATIGRKAIP